MNKILARTLLKYNTEDLWQLLTGDFILVTDDGEIVTNARETIYSHYCWQFHREYPHTPFLLKHHVQTLLGGKRLGSNTHLDLLGICMWAVYDTYCAKAIAENTTFDEPLFRDQLAKRVYELTNEMYNELTYKLEEHVTSLDITDFINVIHQPQIRQANESALPNQQSLDKTYAIVKDALINSPDLANNPISLAARSNLVNMGQILQCIAPRGYLTDTDSNVFPVPILVGYTHGMRAFYDSFIESRSAAKSLIFSKSPLQQAEYFSRRLQLMSQIVQSLHYGDCGSTDYLLWKVRGPSQEGSVLKHKGDLKQLAGKYYMDTDGVLKIISANDTSLIGRTLKIRTVIHCAHPDPYGICSTCFGELALSVPEHTNIGQMCCTSLAQKSSQSVLSVKHLDGSSVVDGIILMDNEKKYLKVACDDNSYMLADCLKGEVVSIIISAEQASNITDIMEVRDVSELNITRVSELSEIGISVLASGKVHVEVIDVSLNQRLASMTYAMLEHIRSHGWSVDERGNYVIDMKDWDWTKEILTLPLRHINLSDHSRDIASMLESSVDKLYERDNKASAATAVVELFDLVNDRLTVNLAVLEVVLYASMTVSVENEDFALPKPWTDGGLGVMRTSMANRSLSAAFAYENHREVITSPDSFVNTNRPEHPFDNLLVYHD